MRSPRAELRKRRLPAMQRADDVAKACHHPLRLPAPATSSIHPVTATPTIPAARTPAQTSHDLSPLATFSTTVNDMCHSIFSVGSCSQGTDHDSDPQSWGSACSADIKACARCMVLFWSPCLGLQTNRTPCDRLLLERHLP